MALVLIFCTLTSVDPYLTLCLAEPDLEGKGYQLEVQGEVDGGGTELQVSATLDRPSYPR